MNRWTENRLIMMVLASAMVIGATLFWVSRGGATVIQDVIAAPTPTPQVSEQARAEAVDLLSLAVARRTEGQLGAALELSDQALGKWPQYDPAQRFVLTVVPLSTAVALSTQARGTAIAAVAVRQSLAGVEARRVYVSRAGLALQRYADALGSFYDRNRQARERPGLAGDAIWRARTGASLATMREATEALVALQPVPEGLAPSAALFGEMFAETAALARDYADGLGNTAAVEGAGIGAGADGLPFASTRTERASDLTRQANIELRRSGPVAP